MSDIVVGNVPAQEAIDHLREKLSITTRGWTDLLGEVNAKAFGVAGATKLELVNDLRAAVTKALEAGTSLSEFRKDFDKIVAKHGWQYKGQRGWRTRIILDTNLRTAHAAGRWKQLQRVKKARPFLVYMTVDDSRVREEHMRWHKLALSVDDPFWNTHFPPNDFGCRCDVISANERLLKRMGIKVANAPEIELTERINERTGEYLGEAPKGIGTGWNYNVGKAWLGPDLALGKHLAKVDSEMRRAMQPTLDSYSESLNKSWRFWLKYQTDKRPNGYAHTVGFLPQVVIEKMRDELAPPANAAIVIFDNQTSHLRGGHKKSGSRFPENWLLDLPRRLQNYQAILKHKNDYVFVLKGTTEDDKQGRAVVAVNFKRKGKVVNNVRSLGVMHTLHLKSKDYELIEGKL